MMSQMTSSYDSDVILVQRQGKCKLAHFSVGFIKIWEMPTENSVFNNYGTWCKPSLNVQDKLDLIQELLVVIPLNFLSTQNIFPDIPSGQDISINVRLEKKQTFDTSTSVEV